MSPQPSEDSRPMDTDAYLRHSRSPLNKAGAQRRPPADQVAAWPSVAAWWQEEGLRRAGDTIAAALDQARSWDRFVCLAVRLDGADKNPPRWDAAGADPGRTVGAVLDGTACSGGPVAQDLAVYWVQDTGDLQPARLAGDLVQQWQRQAAPPTVSVGAAVFPQLTFLPEQIAANACKALDHAAFLGPGAAVVFDAVSLNISGDRFYQAGDTQAAMAEYRLALELDADNANVHNSLGVCLAETGDLEAALDHFRRSAALAPDDALPPYNIGQIHRLAGRLDQAARRWRQALELDPHLVEAHVQLARLLHDRQDWSQALEHLETATGQRSRCAPAWALAAECLHALGRTDAALEAAKKAVRLNPHDAKTLYLLGCLYDDKEENPEIVATFLDQAVQLAPENGDGRLRLARACLRLNQPQRALQHLEAAARCGLDASELIAQARRQIRLQQDAPKAPQPRRTTG